MMPPSKSQLFPVSGRLLFCLLLVLPLFVGVSAALWAQQPNTKATLSGYVRDKNSGEDIIGATVQLLELRQGTVTNEYGFFSLTVAPGEYTLVIQYVGYERIEQKVSLTQNQSLKLEMAEEGTELEEVEITAERNDANVSTVGMSTVKVNIQQIKSMPALMGEVDLVRTIQMLPGVQTSGEASTGFYVRGGGADQNLILLDEATVYNASHLLGIFSVFNADAVKDVQLFKGGIPARYGGRISSVLDVRMREGNSKKFALLGGVGTVSSRLTLEAPIIKDRLSFIASGRRTYADLFLLASSNEAQRQTRLFFWDLNGKLNYKLNESNRFFISAYGGRDVFAFARQFQFDWGNFTTTARWNKVFNNKLFSNLTYAYSNYDYGLGVPSGPDGFKWRSVVQAHNIRYDWAWYLNPDNTVRFGYQGIAYRFNPGDVKPTDPNSIFEGFNLGRRTALEHAMYLENEQKLTDRWMLSYGLRFSGFNNVGADTVYIFGEATRPNTSKPRTDTLVFDNGDFYNSYWGLEPRLGAKYQLASDKSIKFSYNRTLQYIHLVSNTQSITPLDVWVPSGRNIKPQIGDQVAAGYFQNFAEDKYEASLEIYYKYMQNVVDYIDNANLILNKAMEGELLYGVGWSYGAELLVRKNIGKLTGWVSYTLAWSYRQVDGIENGDPYRSPFDQRHNLKLIGAWKFHPRWEVGGNFVYTTGRPLTMPAARYEIEGSVIPYYTERNGYNLPDYHRLDLSITRFGKPNKRWQSEYNLSIYNVYNRRNPYSITPRPDPNDPTQAQAVMLYIFPIIPSFTYNFRF